MTDVIKFPIDVTYQVTRFRDFLVASWASLDILMTHHNWDDDVWFSFEWIQVNWEFLMERELLGNGNYLIPLDGTNRITFPEQQATYKVICDINKSVELRDWKKKTLNYEGEELFICGFRSRSDMSFGLYPPFDFVRIRTAGMKKLYTVPFDSCTFLLKPIQEV